MRKSFTSNEHLIEEAKNQAAHFLFDHVMSVATFALSCADVAMSED